MTPILAHGGVILFFMAGMFLPCMGYMVIAIRRGPLWGMGFWLLIALIFLAADLLLLMLNDGTSRRSFLGDLAQDLLPAYPSLGMYYGPGIGLIMFLVGIWPRFRSPATDPGRCRICGSNLTGNMSGVCPECGKPIPPTMPDSSKT
ncbi:MAG: hypothetical protein HZA51_09000 [Planctomycetes bacterium]|nr:hypothetical protein [Planctomycetota bacterium]